MKKIILATLIFFSSIKVVAQCLPMQYSGNTATISCGAQMVSIPLSTTVTPVACVWEAVPGLVGGANSLNPTVNMGGIYSFTLTDLNNSCETYGNATVYQNQIPDISLICNPCSICIGQTTQLTASVSTTGAYSYSWSPTATINSINNNIASASPTINVLYSVDVTDLTNGCSGSASIYVVVDNCQVGLIEKLSENLISIYPNPNNGVLIINTSFELQKIEITSITGQILLSETPSNKKHLLDLENYSNGIYFLNIYQNNKITRREKVIVNK